MTKKEELSEVLRMHRLWLRDEGGERADLSGADLSGADLSGADLSGADLSRAILSEANLSGANLSEADLSGADLSGADLSGADLSGADLSRAILSEANLSLTKISNDEYLIKSLFINGTRHSVSWWGLNMVTIGCHQKPISWWKKNYQRVVEEENYTPEQINEYRQYILICEKLQKSLKY